MPEILFKYCFFNTNFINSVVGTLSLEVFTLNRIAVHIMFFSSVVSMCLQEQTQSPVSHTGSPKLGHILLKKKIYFRGRRRELYFILCPLSLPLLSLLNTLLNNLHTTHPLKVRFLTRPQHPTMNEEFTHPNHVHLS